MSAGFDLDLFQDAGGEITNRCSVVSIYEELGGRDILAHLCFTLARRFREEVEFQFDWWRFKFLADQDLALDAAQAAAAADLILVAPQAPDLPPAVQLWFEGWLPNRKSTDGALVLVQPSPTGSSMTMRSYLRIMAKGAGLDYFRLNPPSTHAGLPDADVGFPYIHSEYAHYDDDGDRVQHWGINE